MAFNWNKFPWTNFHDLNLDWIIQTVKTLENNLADAVGKFTEIVNTAITNTLTGSGDLTITKTGDVKISGNSVQLSKTVISAGSEQLTMRNPNSNTSVTANYNSGVLTLTNNQNPEAGGVAIYPINTPADGGGDNSPFAANVGYVKDAVTAVDGKLDMEISNRATGDAALQSTIDSVIMPLITAVGKRAPCVVHFDTNATTVQDADFENIKTALLAHTPIILNVDNLNHDMQFTYYLNNCSNIPSETSVNGSFSLTFKTLDGLYKASIHASGREGVSPTITFTTEV